jgi:hypothetical protein
MSEITNKYSKGKIYKVFNTINDEIYVGSTVQSLSDRLIKHKDDVRANKEYQTTICKLMTELGQDNFFIELIEDYPCTSRQELNAREGFWIKQIGTVNKCIMGRTKAEHFQDNKDKTKEKRAEYKKQYMIENKDKIVEQRKEYYERTKEQKQEYQKSDKVKAWKNTKVECPCGGSYNLSNKSTHFKCVKHLAYEEALNNPNAEVERELAAKQKKEEQIQKRKETQKAYRETHKEQISEQCKKYHEEKKDEIQEYKREHYEKNKEAIVAKVQKWYQENKEKKKEYDKLRRARLKEAAQTPPN